MSSEIKRAHAQLGSMFVLFSVARMPFVGIVKHLISVFYLQKRGKVINLYLAR